MAAHLRILDYGTAVGGKVLGEHRDLKVQLTHSMAGGITFEYPRSSPHAGLLVDGTEKVLQVVDHTSRALPEWFLLADDGDNTTDANGDARMVICAGVELPWAVLSEAVVYPAEHTPATTQDELNAMDQTHSFKDATPGKIMRVLLQRAQARGALTGLTWTFTDTRDSAGLLWPATDPDDLYDPSYQVGMNYADVLGAMVGNGWCDVRTAGYELKMFVTESASVKTDRPGVVLSNGQNLTDAPRKRTRRNIINTLLGVGAPGNMVELTHGTDGGRRKEGYLGDGRMTTGRSLATTARAELKSRSRSKEGITLRYAVIDSPTKEPAPQPTVDFQVGDTIRWDQYRTHDGSTLEPLRVMGLTWELSPSSGSTVCSIELNDLFMSATERLQRIVQGINNGSVSPGAPVPDPDPDPSDFEDKTTPRAVTNVKVVTRCYLPASTEPYRERPVGEATVTWTNPTTNTDGSPITDGDRVEVKVRVNSDLESAWVQRADGSATDEEHVHDGLRPGATVQYAVRYRDRSNNDDGWVLSAPAVVAADTTPPPQPAVATLTTERGVVRVASTLKDTDGFPLPNDLAQVEAWRVVAGGDKMLGYLTMPGEQLVVVGNHGETVTVYLIAVDTSGNRSVASAQASIQLVGLVDGDLIATTIEAQLTAANAAAADALTKAGQARDDAAAASGLASGASQAATDANNAAVRAYQQALAAATQGPSLVFNGDFELGDEGWGTTTFQQTAASSTARSGGRVMRLDARSANRWPTSVAVQAATGRVYLCTAWFRSVEGTAGSVGFLVQPRTEAGGTSNLSPTASRVTNFSATGWTQVQAIIPITTANTVTARFAPYVVATPTGAIIEVDDFTVHDITEAEGARVLAESAASDAAAAVTKADNAITSSAIEYAVGPSETAAPTTGWGTATPDRTPGTFVWMRTRITYGSGASTVSSPVILTGPAGSPGAPASTVDLTATTQVLTSPSAGGATSPAAATVTAAAVNTTIAAWAYSVDGAAFSATVPPGVARNGATVTITGATLAARTVAVRATGASGVADTLTVAKVADGAAGGSGADAYTVLLTNEAHTFPGTTAAAVAGSATTSPVAYKGGTQQSVTVGTITGQVTGLTTSVAGNGSTAPTITVTVTTALTTKSGTLTIPLTVDGRTFTKTLSWSLSLAGAPGGPGAPGASITSLTPYFRRQPTADPAPAKPTTMTPTGWVATEPAYLAANSLYRTERVVYSTGAFAYTDVTKVSSWEIAATALTSANGRNSRITSTSVPTGTVNPTTGLPNVAGDTWWQWDSPAARNVIGQWQWSGTAWLRELIGHETIASVDVNKLVVTGSARMAQAVVDRIIGDAGHFGLLTAEQLTIGREGNLIPNGQLEKGTLDNWGAYLTLSTDVPVGTGLSHSVVCAAGQGTNAASLNTRWAVDPGQKYRFEVWMKADIAGSRIYIEMRDADGARAFSSEAVPGENHAGDAAYPVSNELLGTAWKKYVGVLTPRAGRMIRVANIYWNHPNGTTQGAKQSITGMRLTPMTGAVHIENGAVAAQHLVSDTAMVNRIAGMFAEFDTTVSNWIKAGHIEAGAVDADAIAVDALNGKLIVGPDIRSTTTPWTTGGFQATSTFFRMWDSAGTRRVNMVPSTGLFEFQGDFYATNNQDQGISMHAPTNELGGWITFHDGLPWSAYIATGHPSDVSTERASLTLVSGETTRDGRRTRLRLEPDGQIYLGGSPTGQVTGDRIGLNMRHGFTSMYNDYPEAFIQLATAGSLGVRLAAASALQFIAMADRIEMPAVLRDTRTTASANMVLVSSGRVALSSSLNQDKLEQAEMTNADAIYDLTPRTWVDRGEHEADTVRGRYLGFIAEEVAVVQDRHGLEGLTVLDGDGALQSVAYDRLVALTVPALKALRDRVRNLEAQLG